MNRTIALAALVLLVASTLPVGVQAQELAEVEIFTESDSDISTQSGAPESSDYSSSDLAGLYIQEGPDAITFRVAVREVSTEDEVVTFGSGTIDVFFQLGDDVEQATGDDNDESGTVSRAPQYALEFNHGDSWLFCEVYLYDEAADRYVYVGELSEDELMVDTEQNSFIAEVPRDFLQDFNGAQVSPSLPLRDFYVTSYAYAFGESGEDSMPDDEVPAGQFVPELGVAQTGHLHLESPAPVRASNGEATTYVYDVALQSFGDFIDDVDFSVVDVPPNWDIKLPAQSVRIDNETNIHMPVLVTIPFGHKHGTFQSFILEAQSSRDPGAVGRIELGVRFTDIPQPTGHHSMLWFHSYEHPANEFQEGLSTVGGSAYGTPYYAYFNAAEGKDDDRDKEIDVPPDDKYQEFVCEEQGGAECVQMTYEWRMYLEPSLLMGLDFDLNQTGTLSIPFQSQLPFQDAVIEGELLYQRSEDANRNNVEYYDSEEYEDYEEYEEARAEYEESILILGTFSTEEPQSSSSGQETTFDATLTPTPESDFLLYEPQGATMWIELRLMTFGSTTFFADGQVEPQLIPGGEMLLPLNEYHDPVDDLYNQLTDVEIAMESDQEQYVNSAETVLFEVRIENTGVVNDQFHLNISGTNSEWATILGDTSFSVRSHESRRVVIAVYAPLNTVQGDNADLVLEAVSESDDNARALVRLYAEVDNLVDHEDKSHLVPITHDELTYTPVGAWLTPLALLGGLFVARRTRRL